MNPGGAKKEHHLMQFGKYSVQSIRWVHDNDYKYFKKNIRKYMKYYTADKKKYCERLINKDVCLKNVSNGDENVSKVLTDLKKGKTERELMDKFGHISRDKRIKIFRAAKEKFIKTFEDEKKSLIDLHILRYNKIYQENIDFDVNKIAPQARNEVLGFKYTAALDALVAKEKLLGIHTKNFKLEINNLFAKKKRKDTPDYTFFNLSLKEKIELRNLISELKGNNKENVTFVKNKSENSNEESVIINDVEIVYPIQSANIENTEKVISIEEKVDNKSSVIDMTENIDKSKTIDQVSDNIKKSMLEQIRKIYDQGND